MSKKTLLNETQVRRFMKLSQIGTLSDGFVNSLSEAGYFTNEQEEEMPGDEGPADDLDMDMGADEEPPVDDMDLDDMGDDDMGDDLEDAAGESLPPEVVSQVEDALAQALGAMETALEDAIPELDLSVEQTDDADADAMDAEDDPTADDPALDMDAGDDPMADDPALDMGPEEPSPEDELVERIVRRVAERLRKGSK